VVVAVAPGVVVGGGGGVRPIRRVGDGLGLGSLGLGSLGLGSGERERVSLAFFSVLTVAVAVAPGVVVEGGGGVRPVRRVGDGLGLGSLGLGSLGLGSVKRES
jgi:hypothetical protein